MAVAKHVMARLTPEQRRQVLDTVPEFRQLQHARRMLWQRIGMCGNEGSAEDRLDLHSGRESLYFGDHA
jgi:hypothetical protein